MHGQNHIKSICIFEVCHPTRFGELSPSSGTLQSFLNIIKYHKYQMSNFTKKYEL